VLRATRALLSEFRLRPQDWPQDSPLIQSALNSAPSARLGNRSPITVFTGLQPDSPLRAIARADTTETLALDAARAQQIISIESIKAGLDALHKEAQATARKRRDDSRARINAQSRRLAANFDIGEFVLVAKREFAAGDKLTVRWRGPRCVVSVISEFVYAVEDLLTGVISAVHSSRLRFYSDSSLNVCADLLEQVAHNEQGYSVSGFRDLKYDKDMKSFTVRVSWHGFEPEDDTHEPL
jgi:hypothetical protein